MEVVMIHYSLPGFEEPVNSWTHLAAAFAFFSLTLYLLRPSGIGRKHILSILVFGFTCVFLFSMSGVYHLLETGGTARYVLRILDHAGIYMLIAGSFTAIHGVLFQGFMRWGVISLVWILAVNGITLGTIFFDDIPDFLNLIFFLGFGWLGVFTGVMLWKQKGFAFIRYFLLGGLAYTVGAILEFYQAPVIINGVIGGHELFHVCVILGTTFHWVFVIQSIKKEKKP